MADSSRGRLRGWLVAVRFAWHEATRTVVIADVHLGAEVSLARQGIYLPDVSTRGILRAWDEVVKVGGAGGAGAKRVVMAGDVFDTPVPNAGAVGLLERLMGMLGEGVEVVVTRGNHDPEEGFWREKLGGVKVVPKFRVGGGDGDAWACDGGGGGRGGERRWWGISIRR